MFVLIRRCTGRGMDVLRVKITGMVSEFGSMISVRHKFNGIFQMFFVFLLVLQYLPLVICI